MFISLLVLTTFSINLTFFQSVSYIIQSNLITMIPLSPTRTEANGMSIINPCSSILAAMKNQERK